MQFRFLLFTSINYNQIVGWLENLQIVQSKWFHLILKIFHVCSAVCLILMIEQMFFSTMFCVFFFHSLCVFSDSTRWLKRRRNNKIYKRARVNEKETTTHKQGRKIVERARVESNRVFIFHQTATTITTTKIDWLWLYFSPLLLSILPLLCS